MPDFEHLKILSEGCKAWNKWRNENDKIKPNLREANLRKENLIGVNFSGTNLRKANLVEANLRKANLIEAILIGADLSIADFRDADLRRASLEMANLVETNLEGTDLSDSNIYGISAWNLKINQRTKQLKLIITPYGEPVPVITADSLEVAQFIYLLLNRENLRNILKTITSKSVLILGRFTPERKVVLHDYRLNII